MSTYTVTATRTGVRTGEVFGAPDVPRLNFGTPPEFKGSGGTWTPEHFFNAAIATCFMTTFEAIAEFSKFTFGNLVVEVEGTLEKVEKGYRFTRVRIRPTLTLNSEEQRERGLRMLEKAERACLISRSVSSEITLEPDVRVVAST